METKRRRLLLADDSLTIQKVVTLTFSDEGMEVVAVGSGDQAIKYLEESENPPDIVLADVHMPGLTGYEVCERVKRDARWQHLPVVLLAGAFEPFNVVEARRVGADEVLSKPFQSIRDLIGKVGSLLGGKAVEQPEAREEPRPAPEPARAPRTPASADAAAAPDAPDARAASPYVRTDTFADLGADDEMIEATPAERFGARAEHARAEEESAHVSAPEASVETVSAAGDEAVAVEASAGADEFRGAEPLRESWVSERREAPAYAGAARAEVEAHAPRAAFAAHAAGAATADDALLEIGSVELPPAAAEDDDFVLDLDFDEPSAPAPSRGVALEPWELPAARTESAMPSEPDAAGAFAEAAHGDTAAASAPPDLDPWRATAAAPQEPAAVETPAPLWESPSEGRAESAAVWEETPPPRGFVEPQVVASEEPVSMSEDLSVEGDVARPPLMVAAADVSAPPASSSPVSSPSSSSPASVSAEQLSPEMIDAIARRVVELMSERAVQEVAWEVVPALAERLIRQRLDEQK